MAAVPPEGAVSQQLCPCRGRHYAAHLTIACRMDVMMRGPPLAPTTILRAPFESTSMVGDMLERGFFPGRMKLAVEGSSPYVLACCAVEKSSMSLFSKTPAWHCYFQILLPADVGLAIPSSHASGEANQHGVSLGNSSRAGQPQQNPRGWLLGLVRPCRGSPGTVLLELKVCSTSLGVVPGNVHYCWTTLPNP